MRFDGCKYTIIVTSLICKTYLDITMNDSPRVNVLNSTAQLHEQANHIFHIEWFPVPCLDCIVQVALFVEWHHDETAGFGYFKCHETEYI